MKKLKYLAAILIGIAGLGLQQAKADDIILTGNSVLNVANVGGVSGPFGTVAIVLDVTTQVATFTFQSNTAAGYFFIDGSAAGVNVSTTFDNFTLITDSDFKGTSSGNVDGFGTFSLLIDNKDASGNTLVPTISFSIHNTGTTWNSVSDVLAFNPTYDAVAHVNFGPLGNGVTGFVAESGGVNVPDGGTTVMLLGIGLSVLGMARRFLRS
jgi:protein with PEP-CTERM/exosortase system signal